LRGILLRSIVLIVVLITALGAGLVERVMGQSPAPAATEPEPQRDPPPAIPAALLKDTAMITQGEKLWHDQCTHCHGARAYPGKAPNEH
jgi:mono/diheme cytochrome c family protein